jgi:Cof subfamily protein (haloacid dehalogenase superfamily)
MPKIFFFDIDHTLLDHRANQIPPSALEAIASLKADGHTIAIATGRGYGHALEYIEQVQPAYAITQNGARIQRGDQEVQYHPLEGEGLQKLFGLMASRGFAYGATDGFHVHVSALTPDVLTPMGTVDLKSFPADIDHVRNMNVSQGWLFFPESLDDTLLPELLATFPQFDYVRWHATAVDVLPRGIHKMSGCAWVLADAGIDAAEAYAFGDGLNDVEMLQGVGTGIAMGNAHPQLLAVADRVTDAVHQDGVAKMVAQLQREFAG